MSKQITRTATIQLHAPPEKTFPLFTPTEEKLWVRGWDPEYVYPESGEAMPSNVWKTKHDGQEETIWVTTEYNPETNHATYINVTPNLRTTVVDVKCQPAGEELSTAAITYTITALSDEGQKVVDEFTEDYYTHWMHEWQTALNHYLDHGEMHPHD